MREQSVGRANAALINSDTIERTGPEQSAEKRPSIVWVSGLQVFPPLSGGHLRSAGLVTALSRQGFDVSMYSLIGRSPDYRAGKPSEEVTYGPHLREYIDRRRAKASIQFVSYRVDVVPVWIDEYFRFRRPSPLSEWLKRADAVVADAAYVSRVLDGLDKPTVLNTHNVEHRLVPDRGLQKLVRARVRQLESRAARRCDLLCACSESEGEFFRDMGARRVMVVPNGVDLQRFRVGPDVRNAMRRALGIGDDETLFLFSASKFGPNREAYDWLVSTVTKHASVLDALRARIVVAGTVVPSPESHGPLRALGFVPAVEPYFAAADFALNPLFTGAGTNVKMADFMAARLPILTTPFGARGYQLRDGDDAFIFEPDSFLERVHEAVQMSHERRRQLAESAWAANRNAVDIDAVVEPLAEWLRRAIAERRTRR